MRARIAAVSLALIAAAGCASAPQAPVRTSQPESSPMSISPAPLPGSATFRGSASPARNDVRVTSCGTDAGAQTVTGVVTNSANETRDYAIIVLWLRNDSGTPSGSALVIVRGVAAGAHQSFEATAIVGTKADKCILNVTAGRLK